MCVCVRVPYKFECFVFVLNHFVATKRKPKLKGGGAGGERVRDEFSLTSGWCRLVVAMLIAGCCLLFGLLEP